MNWEFNGVSLEFDIEDAETIEKYENALEEFNNSSVPKCDRISEYIKIYCSNYRKFFAKLFDEETSKRLFTGVKDNCRIYDEVMESLLQFVNAQAVKSSKRADTIKKKYLPKNLK